MDPVGGCGLPESLCLYHRTCMQLARRACLGIVIPVRWDLRNRIRSAPHTTRPPAPIVTY